MDRPASPSSSISSSAGSKLRADSVSAHPLLAGGVEVNNGASTGTIPVKYKPRQAQRVSEPQSTYPSASNASLSSHATASTIEHAAMNEASPSQATFKLQTQSLQAMAQVELGLSNESTGWAILQRLVYQPASRHVDRLWSDLVAALGSGKVALLLPRETLPTGETVSAGLLADHCVLLENASKQATCVATLSGLRGVLDLTKQQLNFSSLVPIPDEAEQQPTQFASDDLRRSLLGEPVRRPDIALPQRAAKYTNFALAPNVASLSVPQQAAASTSQKPMSMKSMSPPGTATSKLASLFGGKQPGSAGMQAQNSNSGSEAQPSPPSNMPLSLSAFGVDRVVRRPDVAKGISRAAEARVRFLLGQRWPRANSGFRKAAWDDIVERCIGVLNAFQPPKLSNWSNETKGKTSLYHAPPEIVAAALQDLYEQVTIALARPTPRRKPSLPAVNEHSPPTPDAADSNGSEIISDEEADSILGAVEDVITAELYDRLFCPSESQDAVDDENLAARIAGLNLLEISLDHLGLAIETASGEPDDEKEEIRDGLSALTSACAQELRRLQDIHNTSPRQKLDVLVAAHKLIVDRIALLPPIPQKDEHGSSTPLAGNYQREIELSDDARSFGSRSQPETPLKDGSKVEHTPRQTSRPPSVSDAALPEIKLPEATVNGTSYFDERSTRKAKPTASGADMILPILIWCILQANPQRLVSDLLYIERFHAGGLLKGESSYCLVNFQAVLEFLLNVDLGALGLGASSDRLLSFEPLSAPSQAQEANALRLARDRVSTEVASFAMAAGKGLVGLGGAVEDGYRMLGGLLARSTASLDAARQPHAVEGVRSVLDTVSPPHSPIKRLDRQPLLRQISTPLFGGQNDAVAARNRSKSDATQRELQEVSPAASGDAPSSPVLPPADAETRSGRSFSLLLSSADKPSLGDRLASLARFGSPDKGGTPSKPSSRPPSVLGSSPLAHTLSRLDGDNEALESPAVERFLTCTESDLRIGELGALLADYRRLAAALARRGLLAHSAA